MTNENLTYEEYEEYMYGSDTLGRIQYMALQTKETAFQSDISIWQLTEGNWSCDCNRRRAFGEDSDHEYCLGCNRYIVIDIESEVLTRDKIQDIIEEANEGYR